MASKKSDIEKQEEIDALLSKVEPKLRKAFEVGIAGIASGVSIKDIGDAIESGNAMSAVSIINELIVGSALLDFQREIQNAVQSGGDLAASWAAPQKIVFQLNVTESNVSRFINEYQSSKIRGIVEEMQRLIGKVVLDGVNDGIGPKEIALRVRDHIGLTERQEAAIKNYERLLREKSRDVLSRTLRDKRFDRTVLSAIRETRDIPEYQIEKMVQRYRERMLKYRATTIARTESLRLVSYGNDAFWQQAVRNGIVAEARVKREWITTRDGKVREAHASIPLLNKEGVGLNEPFKSIEGAIMFPGDPSAPVSMTANCRCAVFTRIDPE